MSLHLRQPPKQRAAGPKQDGALGIPDPELNDDRAMNDDDKKATEGTGEKATNDATKPRTPPA
jgi:hypothetical protein